MSPSLILNPDDGGYVVHRVFFAGFSETTIHSSDVGSRDTEQNLLSAGFRSIDRRSRAVVAIVQDVECDPSKELPPTVGGADAQAKRREAIGSAWGVALIRLVDLRQQ